MEKYMKNVMETVVEQKMEELLPHMDCCQCKQCRMDIMAYALNQLPPKYVVSTKGELFAKVENCAQQRAVDLTAAITKAVEIVSKNPYHDA